MLRKLLLVFSSVLAGLSLLNAQTGSLKIKLVDKKSHDAMPFASVLVEQNGVRVVSNQTNIDGEVMFTALPPGNYDVKASFVGYTSYQKTGERVSVDQTKYIQFDMEESGKVLNDVIIEASAVELVDKNISTSATVTGEDYQHMATTDVNAVVATGAGIFQTDRGKTLDIRGDRGQGTTMYVDGVMVPVGSAFAVSNLDVEQITTITGGIPAQYGQALGGVIAITTKGIQPNFFTTVEGESSQYLDAFGHNNGALSFGGPLYSKRDTAGHKKPIIGFNFSSQITHDKNPNPSAIGSYALNSSTLSALQNNPLQPSSEGSNVASAAFVNPSDLQKIPYQQDVAYTNILMNGKLKFALNDNTDLTIAGNYAYTNQQGNENGNQPGNAYSYSNTIFNPSENPQVLSNTINLSASLVERFNTKNGDEKDKSNALITNAVYSLRAEYTRDHGTTQDPNYKNNFFDYGYVGDFNVIKGKDNYWSDQAGKYVSNYAYSTTKNAYVQQGLPGDSVIKFTPGTVNPNSAAYTSDFYSLRGSPVHDFGEIQQGLGLLNGGVPGSVYSLWDNTGTVYPQYSTYTRDQFRVFTSFSASIKNHNIQVGFDYYQDINSQYIIDPAGTDGLWTLMRQLANSHLTQLDTSLSGTTKTTQGPYTYISYKPLSNTATQATQTQFDKSLRAKLGLPETGTTIINTDGLAPSFYSLSMFSPDNLLNQGSSLISYNGYSYTGTKLNGTQPSFADYFTAKDANGNYTRAVGAFEPIFISGYVQDQFDIADLKVRLGLRVESYDANQEVLKDPFSLYAIKTVGEATNLGPAPSNIPSNYVVYVNNPNSPTEVVGYRNPNSSIASPQWYTPQGVLVNNPTVLSNTAGLSQLYPYLVTPNPTAVSPNAFKEYVPAVNVLPRIAFAFPISDLAQFNANYDIITQRPGDGTNYANPLQYLQWSYGGNQFLANPALLPQKTTNYEIGYKQYLSDRKNSALSISTFYKQMRNMEDEVGVVDAYPTQYTTFGSIDYATVKGMSVAYEMRRVHNIQLSANYTLQFADGTGSSATDGVNLVAAGLPNLRSLIPLSYDRRNAFNVVADYRYGYRTDYNGPVWVMHKGMEGEKVIRLLENVGFNLTATAGSGTPYSRQANVTEGDANGDVAMGVAQRSILAGSPDGSNMPWSYRLDLKVDKSMMVTWRSETDGKPAKKGRMNVYIRVLNLLNTQNVIGVYRYTGNPGDDGFLTSSAGQTYAAAQSSPSSFAALYNIKVNNPANYSIPREIIVGFRMDL